MTNAKLKVLDLFSGIGGFSLGLERMGGFETVAFCELNDFCRSVLAKHWPDVPCHSDVRTLNGGQIYADVVCGGFPCQPFSTAARGRNTATDLWPHMLRVLQDAKPTWVIGENVAQLRGLALDQVCVGLETSGFEVAVLEIPACAVGKDHLRRRLWILGYANRGRKPRGQVNAEAPRVPGARDDSASVGAAHGLPGRMDRRRMRALGNAIVPQIAEIIGNSILAAERSLVDVS